MDGISFINKVIREDRVHYRENILILETFQPLQNKIKSGYLLKNTELKFIPNQRLRNYQGLFGEKYCE